MNPRKTKFLKLRRTGLTLTQIGRLFKISRQRVHQIIGNTGGGRYGRKK